MSTSSTPISLSWSPKGVESLLSSLVLAQISHLICHRQSHTLSLPSIIRMPSVSCQSNVMKCSLCECLLACLHKDTQVVVPPGATWKAWCSTPEVRLTPRIYFAISHPTFCLCRTCIDRWMQTIASIVCRSDGYSY
ncbi:uncharacterized protein CANTADRAFT_135059 [Suhomyces tanzawaensis NRRL Y-17324]|uniref:Uncharacterized protein n=1 Tax=Suhomyces tanzawaensis NRRL Y-17324 TaxID=984487 RepID=A0A1E4SRJ7_9ASCO|nr:uncharacterized protein CANTADRAFT_135059 [Suhomyces tanzawaensis NRRL Y-17324]ODV82125.1 hypothetical protein CANTADRAFT_135059 [Suhomyces tanzawaensis NRRL Y-17324]